MFDAYKTEIEIKKNVADFILDWKNIQDEQVKAQLRKLWMSYSPKQGSLLSELLIENNYSFVTDVDSPTIKNIAPEYFNELLTQMRFVEGIIHTGKMPKLRSGRSYFGGRIELQKSFIEKVEKQWFNRSNVLFEHQVKAMKTAIHGKDYILSSGTGSGKTESFLFPSIAKVLNETDEERRKPGIRVLIIYPMNALINNQISRLQALIGAQDPSREPIRFALYNSKLDEDIVRASTYQYQKPDYSEWPDHQVMNRIELRENPPHILVTNYSMLEYALIRPKDLPLFQPDWQKLHTIILDEAHTYIGAMAAEISMLLRRVLIAFGKKSENIQFFATSATLGDPDKDGGRTLREFASNLFSKDIASIDYIDGQRIIPFEKESLENSISVRAIMSSLHKLEDIDDDQGLSYLLDLYPRIESESLPDALYKLFISNKYIVRFINSLAKKPFKIADVVRQIGLGKGYDEIPEAFLFIKYLSIIKSSDTNDPLIKVRLHSVVEAPSGVYVCPSCKTFYGTYQETCTNPDCSNEYLKELVVCKRCGKPHLLQNKSVDGVFNRVDWHHNINRAFLSLFSLENEAVNLLMCLQCGAEDSHATKEEDEGTVLIEEQKVTDPEMALYTQTFFQPISVSIELIQKIVVDTLYANLEEHPNSNEKWLPGEGRRLLTFSDSRQGAARLPTRIDWIHEKYLGTRLMYDAVKSIIEIKNNNDIPSIKETFSETGIAWLNVHKKYTEISNIMAFVMTQPVEERRSFVMDEITKKNFHFFPTMYEETHLVDDILNALDNGVVETIAFEEGVSAFSEMPELFEIVGVFDQIENQNLHNDLDTRRKIAYWLMARSFGMITPSRYFPENVGLVHITFPQIETIATKLKSKSIFADYDIYLIKEIIHAFVTRMRDTATLFVDAPRKDSDDTLSSAAKYIFQSVVLNKYMVLERVMVPEGSSMVAHWYNLKNSQDTAAIQILKKAIGKDNLPISDARNIIATVWGAMIENKQLLVEHPSFKNAYALDIKNSRIGLNPEVFQCNICGRISPHHINGKCLTPSCKGVMERILENSVKDLYGNSRAKNFPKLGMRTVEHSAQLDLSELSKNERRFTSGEINLLSSSTTMELGIDIGGLSTVFLTNCPPGPSNYLQRAGRAGRRSDRVSYVLTCARKVPLDHYFFLNPDLFFTRKPHDPYVSLNSNKIVLRHLHSYVLHEFFLDLILTQQGVTLSRVSNPLGVYGKVSSFFLYDRDLPALSKPPIDLLMEWLESNPDLPHLDDLMRNSSLALSFNKESLIQEIQEFFSERKEDISLFMERLNAEISNEQAPRRRNALEFHRRDVLSKDIVAFLIDFSFLPKYGFPVDLAYLNTSNHQIKNLNVDNKMLKSGTFRLSRSSEMAISEYAPGTEIIAGKKLLKSKGISLDSVFGYESFDTGRKLERISYVICNRCGHFYTVQSADKKKNCPVCGFQMEERKASVYVEEIAENKNKCRIAILPKGFRVDFHEDQPFAPNKVEKTFNSVTYHPEFFTDPDNFIQVIPDLLSIAVHTSVVFYAINEGPRKLGYSICNSCGRAISELEMNNNKQNPFNNHQRLYGDGICKGSVNHHLRLISRFTTDAIQLRFSSKYLPSFANPNEAKQFVDTFGRCLQLAASKYLGIDNRELKFMVQNYWNLDSRTWEGDFEIILYDNVPGGAGYSEMVRDLFWDKSFYNYMLEATECPDNCSSACPACLVAYTKEENGEISYNRHLVRTFLDSGLMSSFLNNYIGKVRPTYGDHIVNNLVQDFVALFEGKNNGKISLYFSKIPEEQFSITSLKFGPILELAKKGVEVTLSFQEVPAIHNKRQLVENLRYAKSYASKFLHYKVGMQRRDNSIIALIEVNNQRFVYYSYSNSSSLQTPFSSFPFVRRIEDCTLTTPINGGKEWILPHDAKGMIHYKFQEKNIESIETIHLWKALCDAFSLVYTKKIYKVIYSDRYLVNFTENICLLLLLSDMNRTPDAEVTLFLNGQRSSNSDFAFQDRMDQKEVLRKQIDLSGMSPISLRMFVTTRDNLQDDPGNTHEREMYIEYEDGTHTSLSFDSGMSMVKPYIDRFWDNLRISFKNMMNEMKIKRREPVYKNSLVFKYPEGDDEVSLKKRSVDAMRRKFYETVE